MKRACRPSPAWRRWTIVACAVAATAAPPATGQDCASPSFGAGYVSFPVTDAPWAVVEGDFWGSGGLPDGDLDVVVARDGTTDVVTLLTGNGTGAFGNGGDFPVGSGPRDVVAADFDRDGFLDIAVADSLDGTVSLLEGTGNSFVALSPLVVGGTPTRLAVGDFNNDGRPDLVVVISSPDGIKVLLGQGDFTFTVGSDRTLTGPTAAAPGDINGDGNLDLLVTQGTFDQVAVYLGKGDGYIGSGPPWAMSPALTVGVGDEPVDIAVADVDDDGDLDFVTADRSGGTAATSALTVRRGDGLGDFPDVETPNPTGLVDPIRVGLADVDRDGILDLVALDAGSLPAKAMVLLGTGDWRESPLPPTPMTFDDANASSKIFSPLTSRDLALGDINSKGRVDFVVAEDNTTDGFVSVALNRSGPDCPRTSFGDAPRAFPGGDSPWALAVADFDEDGLEDLVAAHASLAELSFLKGNGNGYQAPVNVATLPVRAWGVATADFDFDGHADLVAALGNGLAAGTGTDGEVRVLKGDGMGGFAPMANLAVGLSITAVAIGDFDGDGGPDIAATSDETDELFIFLGDGLGGFSPAPESPRALGGGADPSALAVGAINGDMAPDLAVARYGTGSVSVFLGDGDGTFTSQAAVPVGAAPWSVALGLVDGDGLTDLVTANFSGGDVSLVFGDGNGAFGGLASQTGVSVPISVAVVDATHDGTPDVLVTTSSHTLKLLEGPYTAGPGFVAEETYAVRRRPSQVAPVDADADGTKDLVIPCKDSGDVAVLLARPPGPPAFLEAKTIPVDAAPMAATSGDFDRDGDVDLAVVSRDGNSMTILGNDGLGGFTPSVQSPISVGTSPMAIVAVDLDLDGILDLAVSCAGANQVQFFKGDGALWFAAASPTDFLTVTQPDDLVAGDFDRDGDPDLAVLSKPANGVQIIRNARGWDLSLDGGPYAVGTNPTSIFAADFDWDGILDLAVANDDSDNLRLLDGVADGTFTVDPTPLGLGGDTSPLSVTGGDFDRDGDVDLATVAFGNHRLILFRNTGGLFPTSPTLKLDAPREPSYVATADINRDGVVDLTMAASGLKVARGTAGFTFLDGEDFLAGITPIAVVPADFNRDGLPDVAVVNSGSDDISILLSTACVRRRLVLSTSPAACAPGPSPFSILADVQVQDDGGNLLTCESGNVNASLVAGPGALGGTTNVPVSGGTASFNALNISPGGVRFVLQFDLSGVPPVLSRSFSLEPAVEIVGPTSVCPSLTESYTVSESLDSYFWTISPAGPGYPTFTPTASLVHADLTPPDQLYTLALQGQVDGCSPSDSLDVYVGNLFAVTIASSGPFSACVDCFGGTFAATETGGGTPTGRQWGYRTVSMGAITPLPGETDETYVFKGTDFPGPGSYYLVETTTPASGCGLPVNSNEITVTVTASVPAGEVQSLGVLSRGSASFGENVLQWVNSGSLDHVLIRWNKAPTGTASCTPPLDPFTPSVSGEVSKPYGGSPPARDSFPHGSLEPDTAYCYSVFATVDGVNYEPGRIVKARPFDTAGSVKWAYATGATAVAPPAVAEAGIVALSNDRTVHSLLRGINGGIWPGAWMPATLTGVAHSRSPVVPLLVPVGGADALLFVGDDAGDVFAIDAVTGNMVWGPTTPAPGSKITGAPGGLFVQYGAPADVVVVGTRNDATVDGALHTLSLTTGTVIDSFSAGGSMGPVTGTPVIDNAGGRVWVSSFSKSSGPSLWCVDVDLAGMMSACSGFTAPNLGNVVTSPVLRSGRLYVGNTSGEVYSVDAATGAPGPAFLTSDGAVKGFLWPDRRHPPDGVHDDDLYFATNGRVWSVTDTAGTLTENWSWNAGGTLQPNVVLQWPQTNLLYVGSQSGTLYELDFTSANMVTPPVVDSRILGAGIDHVGAPSLDIGVEPPDVSVGKKLILVGSEAGVLYELEISLGP